MRDKPSQVTALVGGQYGSEGKGAIAAHLAKEYDVAVRVGAANAGHTFYTYRPGKPEKQVVQQLPCAAYANPECTLILGPGALISPEILYAELEHNREWREQHALPEARLLVDYRAHVVQAHHIEREQATDLAERIGSTSTIAKEGIGAAEAAKVMREHQCVQALDIEPDLEDRGAEVLDVVSELRRALDGGAQVMLEGTQGTGLSLTHGHFPYTTSRDTTAGALAAQCGIGPTLVDDVFMVMRTFPIRVHGNSGPFWFDSREVSFAKLGLEPERTTVTKLERRIATFSYEQAKVAAQVNGATGIALTFADYVMPGLAGVTDPTLAGAVNNEQSEELLAMINTLERECRCPVYWVGTGPRSIVERYDRSTIEAARGWAYTTAETI